MNMKKPVSKNGDTRPSRFDLAAPVSAQVEILEVRLVETNARRSSVDIPSGNEVSVQVGFRVRTDVDRDGRKVTVSPRFRVDSADAKRKGASQLLQIEAEFQLIYSINSFDQLTDENFKAFGELNGIFNCWPYWREYVQQTTVRMGLPPLTLPVYRPDRPMVPEKSSRKKSEK